MFAFACVAGAAFCVVFSVAFGFAIGLQLFLWGLFGPVFGIITDKYGGKIAIFIGFLFYLF